MMAREISAKLAEAMGKTALFLPKQGCNESDSEGTPLQDAEGLAAFRDEIRKTCPPNVELIEPDCHINDSAFCDAVLQQFAVWLAEGVVGTWAKAISTDPKGP